MSFRRWFPLGLAAALPVVLAAPAAAAPARSAVLAGPLRAGVVSMFPSDALTVADPSQLTGRRVNLPSTNCGTNCDTIRLLNQLDGFDLDPRIAVQFDQAVDPAQVAAGISIYQVGPPPLTTGVDRVVYDPATHTVYAHPKQQLAPDRQYVITVRGSRQRSEFTTESATTGLLDIRRQLDNGSAFAAAGIAAPSLHIDYTAPAAGTTLAYTEDMGTSSTTVPVPNTSSTRAASYTFGSFQAPSWLTADTVIPQTPTAGSGPQVTGSATLPFVLITPAGTAPPGGWPVAIFGHGFGRDDRDVFLAADLNAAKGIATIATDVVGHGYGPNSTWDVTTNGHTVVVNAHGRGIPIGGVITSTSGVSALPQGVSPNASINTRDGLRQTVADVMTLVRSIGHGDITDLDGGDVSYYGQSFGGIYGTELGGVDPRVEVLALNVAGGPVTEIARLSPSFRPLITLDLKGRGLLNSTDPALDYFDADLPLRNEPPVTNPVPGALAIQLVLSEETWLDRSGDATAYSPLLHDNPPPGSRPKQVIFQNAYGDQTVPNPTNYNVLSAGRLFIRESLYRNDKNPGFANQNPHGFLLNPANPASLQGQRQIVTFLLSHGQTIINPDPALWTVPLRDPQLLESLHFSAPWDPAR